MQIDVLLRLLKQCYQRWLFHATQRRILCTTQMGKIGNVAIIKRAGTTDQRSSKKLTKIVPSNDILKESFSPADFDLQASSSSSSSLAASAASLEMTMMSANSHFCLRSMMHFLQYYVLLKSTVLSGTSIWQFSVVIN